MIIRFAAVGVLNTLCDWLVFFALVGAAGMHRAPANLVSYSAGILVSFSINRMWTFRDAARSGAIVRQGVSYLAVNVAGLSMSMAMVWIAGAVMPAMAAKVLSTAVLFFLNYAGARFIAFR